MGSFWKDASGLAKAATIFAVLGTLSFGICGIGWVFPKTTDGYGIWGVGILAAIGLVVSVLGLLVVSILGIAKFLIDTVSGGADSIRLFDPKDPDNPQDKNGENEQ